MALGIDAPIDCTKQTTAIKAAGKTFVGRYYRNKKSRWAPLVASEVTALQGAGLKVVALWESASAALAHFSYAAGVDEGTSAYHQALQCGQPPATPIYFAVDFDASSEAVAGAINDYFRGVHDGYNAIGSGSPAYLVGVYGSGLTCSWLKMHGRADRYWLALSTKWSGYDSFADWHVKQSKGLADLAINHDNDESRPDFGAF